MNCKREVVKQFTKERHELIHNSFEAKLFEQIVLPIDRKFLVVFEDLWKSLTEKQDTIKGRLDKETFYSHDYGKITRQKIAPILKNKFQGILDVTYKDGKQVTSYLFNPKTLIKLVEKYNISLPLDHQLYQVRPTQETNDEM